MTLKSRRELDPITKRNVEAWLDPAFDEETRNLIEKMKAEDVEGLTNAFYTRLKFGTGGLRGLMGIGTNRMNRYTVSFATQGLANYLLKSFPRKECSVFIGYDSRNQSREFADEAAAVLAGSGIKVYLSKELCPTPFTSFCCRRHNCQAAIMVTASHNPAVYNGYKVYWSDGGQVLPPHDVGIVDEANKINSPSQVKRADANSGLIQHVYEEEKAAYLDAVTDLQISPEENRKRGNELKIIYSNLHGTGIQLVPETLARWGFTNISYVESQKAPDGNFPTVPFPNPEEKEAMRLGNEQLEKDNGDIFIATDPDADRMRAIVRHKGKNIWLNGNQIASIMLYHILKSLARREKLPKKCAFVKTIVTTELFRRIAEGYDRPTYDVLTGFKYIAEKIHEWEQIEGGDQYLFGGEESYGTLFGTHARDKDAVIATALFAETALHAKLEGKTVVDLLHEIYRHYGIFGESLLSLTFPETKEGQEQIKKAVETLRSNPPTSLLDSEVINLKDYETSLEKDFKTGQQKPINLPKSAVLQLTLACNSKITLRPSGTEPKIKLYAEVELKAQGPIDDTLAEAKARCTALLEALKALITQ